MLTTGAATAVALLILVLSCVVAGIIGFLMSLACRLPWSFKVAVLDVGLAAVLSIATAYAYSAIALARGQMDSGVKWIVLTAAGSIVIRHLIRLALRPAN
jgi:hypothetical protein